MVKCSKWSLSVNKSSLPSMGIPLKGEHPAQYAVCLVLTCSIPVKQMQQPMHNCSTPWKRSCQFLYSFFARQQLLEGNIYLISTHGYRILYLHVAFIRKGMLPTIPRFLNKKSPAYIEFYFLAMFMVRSACCTLSHHTVHLFGRNSTHTHTSTKFCFKEYHTLSKEYCINGFYFFNVPF